MGNQQQQIESLNYWSELYHLSEDYNENDSGDSIVNKLDAILTQIRNNDHSLINSLNRKSRVIKKPFFFQKNRINT